MPHFPALDGLRGLAVLGVLFFHAGTPLVGGYLGVDLFFVLSGFLITSLLIGERTASGTIDFRAFWIRRARRLFPALLSIMPAVAIYAVVFAAPNEVESLRKNALTTLAYVANWGEIFSHRRYWDLFRAPSPLEHTWSLAIEEQFYLVWPLFVAGLFAVSKRATRTLMVVCVALACVSAGAMVHYYSIDTMRAYFGTDTRGAAILAGAALAAALAPPSPSADLRRVRALDVAGAVAALVIGYAWLKIDGQAPLLYHGGFWMTELAALVLIGCAIQGPQSWVARALSFGPLRLVGDISYGVYLWHWPVFVVLNQPRTGIHSVALLLVIRFAVTFAIAGVSYRFLEQPIRKRGVPYGVPVALGAAVAAALLVVLCTRPRPMPRPPTSAIEIRLLPPAAQLPANTMRLLVLGDSVAAAIGVSLRGAQSSAEAFVAARGRYDCSILEDVIPTRSLFGKKHSQGNCAAEWAPFVAETQPDATLVLLGGGFFAPAQVNGAWQLPCEKGWHDVYLEQLTRRLRSLYPNGGRVFIARSPDPIYGWQSADLNKRVDCFNAVVDEAARATESTVLDLQGHLCPAHQCAWESKGAQIRPDGLHFSSPGADETAKWILSQIRQVVMR